MRRERTHTLLARFQRARFQRARERRMLQSKRRREMAGRVAGKKAFITGGAQGLGEAMARKLAAEGAKVCVADINVEGARKVAAAINAEHGEGVAFALPLDVTKEDQWIYALEEADEAMGGISVLVN